MLNVEYIITNSFQCSGVRAGINIIGIGGTGYNRLKDSEHDIFISDCITHEFIHALLENTFNLTTSELYEFIGDSLLNTHILRKGVNLTPDDCLWCNAIKKYGNRYIHIEYGIDNMDLIQCYLICNTGVNNE